MATPENLRSRATQAEIAGDENLANSLHAEADELEKQPNPGNADPQ